MRIEVHYRGRVQGVGFRQTAWNLAQSRAVTGFVRNLGDGRVHLVADGEAGEVRRFLGEIARRMSENIEHAEQRELDEASAAPFETFSIRH